MVMCLCVTNQLVEINSFQLLCTAHYVDICCWEFWRIEFIELFDTCCNLWILEIVI
jgi:hypothetical protein